MPAIEQFPRRVRPTAADEGALATVLCVNQQCRGDVVRTSTRWSPPSRRQPSWRVVRRAGSPWVMTFDGPARAIRAGLAMTAALGGAGWCRARGLHTGECDRREGRVAGWPSTWLARSRNARRRREMLMSRTVKDLGGRRGLPLRRSRPAHHAARCRRVAAVPAWNPQGGPADPTRRGASLADDVPHRVTAARGCPIRSIEGLAPPPRVRPLRSRGRDDAGSAGRRQDPRGAACWRCTARRWPC